MGRPVFLVTAAALVLFVGAAGAARIGGTNRAELLRGTPRADVVHARDGADRIKVDGGGRDTVRCGAGSDLVNADLRDRVAADCETVARVVARDRFAGGGAQHATIAEPDTFMWGDTVVAAFQVGRFAGGGAVATGWATSHDRGVTWRSGILPSLTTSSRPAGPWQRASDPVVAYDAAHGVWLIASLALGQQTSAVVVSRSTDGLRWSGPVTVVEAPLRGGTLLDKEWIACDSGASSPHRGSCYVTYSDFRTLRLEFQASRDGGLTWEPQVSAPENAGRGSIVGRWAPAPQPVVQPDGDLIVPFYDEDRVAAVRSADGGRSFSPPVTVARTAFRATPGLRAPPLPTAEVDANGVVYVVWPDCTRTESCRFNQLVISRSADGVAWSSPTRIPTTPRNAPVDVVIPGIGVAPDRVGRLAVAYYVYRAGRFLDVGIISSPNGGLTWRPPRRLSAQSFRREWVAQARGAMVGDYISVSYGRNRVIPAFALASRPSATLNQPLFAASLRP